MKNIADFKILFWDFDGVIMDSMPIRGKGFEQVLKDYPKQQIRELMAFHEQNGGLSRYVKFRFFFEKIRNESISDDKLLSLTTNFSEIMLSLLINRDLLIFDSVEFIENNWEKYEMHIVSGSDGIELRHICDSLGLTKYFKSINGSPTPKNDLVKDLIEKNNYRTEDIALIGDSINDLDAASVNKISFYGYNNPIFDTMNFNYIKSFSNIV